MKVFYKKVDNIENSEEILKIENSFYFENDSFIFIGLGKYVQGKNLNDIGKYLKNKKIINEINIPFTGGLIGSYSYDLIKTIEKIDDNNKSYLDIENINLLLVDTYFVKDKSNGNKYIVSIQENNEKGEKAANKKIKSFRSLMIKNNNEFKENLKNKIDIKNNITKDKFIENVKIAKKYIKEGDIFQVVLSQRFQFENKESPINILNKLNHESSTYKYYFKFKEFCIVGLSPEVLVSRNNNELLTNPIAGTRRRGVNNNEDKRLEKELLKDKKELAEHTMLVDLARNDMGRVSKIGSVKVKKLKKIKKYEKVMHIVSEVLGEAKEDNLEILKTFLPAGTLSGAPKIRAMEIIEELENDKREIYGGGIGYLSFNNNMEIAIAIRTLILKDNIGYLQAGAGIVYDSIPENEYYETIYKASQLISAIGGEVKDDFIN